MKKPTALGSHRAILGESPLWCERTNRLFFCDIRGHALHALDVHGAFQTKSLCEPIGCLALRETGGCLLAMKSGLFTLDSFDKDIEHWRTVEPGKPGNRFNDGKCDRRGRLFAGTMQDFGGHEPVGSFYRIQADGEVSKLISDLHVPNGPCWSPDNRWLYLADTRHGSILEFPFDIEAGVIGKPRILVEPGVLPGKPDGATVDADGCIWTARYGGGCVARLTPKGLVDRIVELPVAQVTSCTFGGADLSMLFITTASYRVGADPDTNPLAGSVFIMTPGVAGLPEPRFAS